jgi:hypothetical protein
MLSDFLNRPVDFPLALPLLILAAVSILVLLDWWGRRRDCQSRQPPTAGDLAWIIHE